MKIKEVESLNELNIINLKYGIYSIVIGLLFLFISFFVSTLYKLLLVIGAGICLFIILFLSVEAFEKKEFKKLDKEKEIELTPSIKYSFNGIGNRDIELSIEKASKNFPIESIYYKNENVTSNELTHLDREELNLLKIKKVNLKYFTEDNYFLYYKHTGTEITKITADIYLDKKNNGQILKKLGFTIDDEHYTEEDKELRDLYSYPDKSIKIKSC